MKNTTHLMGEVEVLALATDGSRFSDGAVQEAIFFAEACAAKLVVLNVIAIDTYSATSVHATVVTELEEIQTYIDNIKKMAQDSGIDCTGVVEESYQPDKTIVELAYKHNADVLLMGRHGRRGLLQLLVGSMTSKVIGHGFPKVLVVPKDFVIGGDKILLETDGSTCSQLAAREAIRTNPPAAARTQRNVLSKA